jgi:hypothetical protein
LLLVYASPFVIAGWFVERGGQFIPAGLIARFDPHDVTCARYVDIFAVRPKARDGNFLPQWPDLARCGEVQGNIIQLC